MKTINNFITEKLRINKNSKIITSHDLDSPGLTIIVDGKEYKDSIGDNLPIIDYAESYEEAIVMIERDSKEGDRFHWLKQLADGNMSASIDYYWRKHTEGDWLIKSTAGTKYNKANIELMYKRQHLMLAKVEEI